MSYYRGDWYRGDPGFFSTIANIGGAALGFLPGIGPAAQKVAQIVRGFGGPAAGAAQASMSHLALPSIGTQAMATAGKSMVRRGVAAVKGHPVLSAAGAAGTIGAAAAVMSPSLRKAAKRMVGAGGEKKRRRMNVCNARALRRAIRRTHGFAKLAMKTIHIVHPKKKGRFGGFRRRRARA